MFDVIVVGGGPGGPECRPHARPLPAPRAAVLTIGQAAQPAFASAPRLPDPRRDPPLELTRSDAPNSAYGVECRRSRVTGAQLPADCFRVSLADGTEEHARYLLIATGVSTTAGDSRLRRVLRPIGLPLPVLRRLGAARRRLACFGHGAQRHPARARSEDLERRTSSLCTNGARLERELRERLARNGITVRHRRRSRGSCTPTADLSRVAFATRRAACRATALFFTTGQHPQSAIWPYRWAARSTASGTVEHRHAQRDQRRPASSSLATRRVTRSSWSSPRRKA